MALDIRTYVGDEIPADPLDVTCPTCHAAEDAFCVTPAGKVAAFVHVARERAAKRSSAAPTQGGDER